MDEKERIVPAGEFKQKCLAILDEVGRTHEPVTITKRNKPVARVVPLEDDREIEARLLQELRSGGGRILVDLDTFLEPTEELAEWNRE